MKLQNIIETNKYCPFCANKLTYSLCGQTINKKMLDKPNVYKETWRLKANCNENKGIISNKKEWHTYYIIYCDTRSDNNGLIKDIQFKIDIDELCLSNMEITNHFLENRSIIDYPTQNKASEYLNYIYPMNKVEKLLLLY